MNKNPASPKTDQAQLTFNQVMVMVGVTASLALSAPEGIYALTLLMLSQHLGFDLLRGLKVLLRVPARIVDEDPRPHRFARTVGGVFLLAASIFFATGLYWVGFGLSVVVGLLAFVNQVYGFCVGCFFYFQLRMLRYRLTAR
jgi:hypothetical protein